PHRATKSTDGAAEEPAMIATADSPTNASRDVIPSLDTPWALSSHRLAELRRSNDWRARDSRVRDVVLQRRCARVSPCGVVWGWHPEAAVHGHAPDQTLSKCGLNWNAVLRTRAD